MGVNEDSEGVKIACSPLGAQPGQDQLGSEIERALGARGSPGIQIHSSPLEKGLACVTH